MNDEQWMQVALEEARRAAALGEIPIGALLIKDGKLLARGINRTIGSCDPSAHAEIVVLREAAKKIENYRLTDTALYVTVEPCVMCVGAMIQARISKLVFGTYNLRGGACGTAFDLTRHPALNHHIHAVRGGVLAEACQAVMQEFFRHDKRDA